MRVIAGTFRSRVLKSPKELALRPTSDMLRETLFNVLGPRVTNSRFVDAFAGTGAVGIEETAAIEVIGYRAVIMARPPGPSHDCAACTPQAGGQ